MYTAAPGPDPAVAFSIASQKIAVSKTEIPVDGGGNLTAFFRHELSGWLNYTEPNCFEK